MIRNKVQGKKGIADMLFLFLIAAGSLIAIIFMSTYVIPTRITDVVNIQSKLGITVTNDNAGTEVISLLNNKAGNSKYIEMIGTYMAQDLEDNPGYIEPFQNTLNTVFRRYDFTVTGTGISFKKDVPADLQDTTKLSIPGCGATAPPAEKLFLWPLPDSSTINSGFGGRELNKGACSCHPGIDIAGDGKAVVAAAKGTIVSSFNSCAVGNKGCNSGYGNYVVIRHTINGATYYTYYDHLQRATVTSGDVNAGDQIGISGNTGYSTGPHLHFEVRGANNLRIADSIDPCTLFQNAPKLSGSCEHEKVAACSYVSGKTVKSYQTDIPLPGPRAGADLRAQVIFKQWD